jgi:hypothetical protein
MLVTLADNAAIAAGFNTWNLRMRAAARVRERRVE